MAITKSSVSVLSSTASTTTSSAIDVSDAYQADVYVSIVVVGTATSGASFQLQLSPDGGTTYYVASTYVAGTAASTYYWVISVPSDTTHLKIAFTQQSGGTSSTIVAQLSKVTGI